MQLEIKFMELDFRIRNVKPDVSYEFNVNSNGFKKLTTRKKSMMNLILIWLNLPKIISTNTKNLLRVA